MYVYGLAILDFLGSALTAVTLIFYWRALLFAVAGIGFFAIAWTTLRNVHLAPSTRIIALSMGCCVSIGLMLYAWLS